MAVWGTKGAERPPGGCGLFVGVVGWELFDLV